MKIAIFGNLKLSEEFVDSDVIDTFAEALSSVTPIENPCVVLLHGGASGVQKIISDWWDLDSVIFKPWSMIWNKISFTPFLFFLRSKQIIDNADKIIVLIDPNEPSDSEVEKAIDYATKRKKKIHISTLRVS